MKKLWIVLISLFVLGLAGLGVFLAYWEIPPPGGRVETVIPDERFPR